MNVCPQALGGRAGEAGDEVSVAGFIADQRTLYRVPVGVCCAIFALSVGWFYKWIKAPVKERLRRRREMDAAVQEIFNASGGSYGSPQIHGDLIEVGCTAHRRSTVTWSRRVGRWVAKRRRRVGGPPRPATGTNANAVTV